MTLARHAARVLLVAAAAAAVSVGGTPAQAAPDRAAVIAAIRKQEDVARVKVADEIRRVALLCALKSDFDGARRDYAKALAFTPKNAALASDLEKIKGKKGKPMKADLDSIAERRTKCLARCSELLTPAALAYAKEDCSDELASLVANMCVNSFPTKDLVAKLDMVLYEPYLDWRTKAAIAKLDLGWEYADGAWADPKKVEAMNAEHATWMNPWVFADEVHEVRTNLPRRMARQVAAHVFAYRNFFLSYFTGEWDFVQPTVKLPVIVTRTRAEMEERVRLIPNAPPAPPRAAAFYLMGGDAGNPCFASVETNLLSGSTITVDFDTLQQTFEHELGHQIAFEYSKHAASQEGNSSSHFLWVIEGVADFLPNYDLVDGQWKLVRRPWLGSGEQRLEAAFAWCRKHAAELPPLTRFFATPGDRFHTGPNYHISATLTGFLLEGMDREYRQEFIALAQAVHRDKADAAALRRYFPDEMVAAIDTQFREYCAALAIEPGEEEDDASGEEK